MLVIEGTDCTGKTTLAKQLWSHPRLQELGMEIQHLSRLPTGHDRTWHYVDRMNPNGIFDRFYLSELAYAAARGDSPVLFTPEKLRWVHAHAQVRGVFTILLTASPEAIRDRWREGEMYPLELSQSAGRYFTTMKSYADKHFHMPYADVFVSAVEIEGIVESYLERRRFIDSLSRCTP